MALGYKPDRERVVLSEDDLPERAPEPVKTRTSRVKPVTACASQRADWAWMALDHCISRHGGGLPHGANKVNGAPGIVEFLRKSVAEHVDGGQESLLVLPVSTQLQILGVAVISKGARDFTVAPLADVFAPVLMLAPATGFILVHNHPTQLVRPSNADDELTRAVKTAAKTLGLRFIDHIIVAADAGYYSYVDQGRMP